jgi:hypothetical protein
VLNANKAGKTTEFVLAAEVNLARGSEMPPRARV